MDRITERYVTEFSTEYHIESLDESERFEHFAAFCVIKQHHNIHFDTDDVVTGDGRHNQNGNDGGGTDTGIDAVAIIVNGTLITDVESLAMYESDSSSLDVQFIFIQAERSSSFSAAKVVTFGGGVTDFFSENPRLNRNARVAAAAEVATKIYELSTKFDRGLPSCKLYYVTTGKWQDDTNIQARINILTEDLRDTDIFSAVELTPVDAARLQALYRQTRNAVTKTFSFPNKIAVGDVSGVKDAYIGFLPSTEFVKVISRETGEMLPGLFESNVRDWYGYNEVNKEIQSTLKSETNDMFVLMNNGITLIARKLVPSGNRLSITDFQIVNGCQTSHVLHDNRTLLTDRVMVPVRIISTDDEGVIASIVRATNRQTEVKEEQFFALQEFPRQLEQFFQSFSEESKRLYYERRTCQYDRLGIDKGRVITEANVIRSFASMFLDEAHRTTRNYKSIRDKVTKEIFAKGHRLEPYYAASYVFYALEMLFKKGKLESRLKPARFHIIMAFRLLVGEPVPPMHANEMSRYCDGIMKNLWDGTRCEELLLKAANIVTVVAENDFQRDNIRAEPFTAKVRASFPNRA
ncbi:MAG: AIPR family protein [Acidimicrobiia bacterium]|nr:AIPR family protein [Acidimicrobiia bacterium]